MRRLNSEDTRYALDAIAGVLEGVGQTMNPR
ncbi:MAG TPA: hypothetical protein VGT04_12735, partial [Acidobacteriaceae bacterium]|nr:hypothetical protein [Acidobacteriaceae bacterium]